MNSTRLALLATALALPTAVRADTFGTGANTFSIDFVTIGNPGNPDDAALDNTPPGFSAPYGGVSTIFRMGTYEVSRDAILKANILTAQAGGSLGIALGDFDANGMGPNSPTRPATEVSWNEAARFVNWLNTSNGYPAAYKFTFQPGQAGYDPDANIVLWEAGDAGFNSGNRFRNTGAFYFLPSEDEWYKAAFYGGSGADYFDYATQQNSPATPTPVASGTASGTAVYNQPVLAGPADVSSAGGASYYGTVGQMGNVIEWTESAFDGVNNSPGELRSVYSGFWSSTEAQIRASARGNSGTGGGGSILNGLRIASIANPIPEPSSALLLAAAGGTLLLRRRRC